MDRNISCSSYECVRKLCREGLLNEALRAVELMDLQRLHVSADILYCLVQGCIDKKDVSVGRTVHSLIMRKGFGLNTFLGSHLIRMFAACGKLSEADNVFVKLPECSVFPWSEIISAHAKLGGGKKAIELYHYMQQSNVKPDGYVFVAILKACANTVSFTLGKLIHAQVIYCGFLSNIFIGNALVDMYAKCGSLQDAHRIFDELPRQDVVSWSSIIAGYAHCGHNYVALQLFRRMQQEGREPNLVTWNATIAGCVENGDGQGALQLFHEMQQASVLPNESTFVSILKACSCIVALEHGMLIHVLIAESCLDLNVCVRNSLINMYAKCGGLAEASMVFDKLEKRDVVMWSTMIASYLQHGQTQVALTQFRQMQLEEKIPDNLTLISILKVCSIVSAVNQGRLIHKQIVENGLESDTLVANSLLEMYVKCGSFEVAHGILHTLQEQSLEAWTTMIAGYALHSKYKVALTCFEDVQQKGLKPDEVTFLCLLSVCSQMGLVEEGCHLFNSMANRHGIVPMLEHYNSMVDILGRTGCLIEAEDLLQTMPFRSDVAGWTSVLSHCKTHRNVNLSQRCFERIVARDGQHISGYALMSDIYGDAALWEDVERVEELRTCTGLYKEPGKAFIEVGNKVHDFMVGDLSHPQCSDIKKKLKKLSSQFKQWSHCDFSEDVGRTLKW